MNTKEEEEGGVRVRACVRMYVHSFCAERDFPARKGDVMHDRKLIN